MAYTKTTWVNGGAPAISAANLNKIEDGIFDAQEKADGYAVFVTEFGAVGDGATDDTAAIQSAFNSGKNVYFPNGTYLIQSSITITRNNVFVDFGDAVIKANFSSGGQVFVFGATADTPTYKGLRVKGGQFTLSNPATTQNVTYLVIKATQGFRISDCYLKNVGNGGILVEAGCQDGVIESVTVDGASGYGTCRGIWLNGATASDYASQLIDITSITRNSTLLPVFAVKNVKVTDCTMILPFYGVYLMNTRDCHITNNYIDISGSGARCISLNVYSPGAVVSGNTLRNDQAGTGVIATQYSHDVIITDNNFLGTFGGGRDVYVAYLSDALITNNNFNTDSSQQILIDMGASAVIKNNKFTASAYSVNRRVVKITTIDEAQAGSSTYGDTATILAGSVFEGNVVRKRLAIVYVNTPTSASGNIPGLNAIVNKNNVLYDFDLVSGTDEYGMRIIANGTTHKVEFSYFDNVMYPADYANRNTVQVTGSGFINVRSDSQSAMFRITNASGGGAVTVQKMHGGHFSCGVVRSANDLVLSPRTVNGAAGASVAIPVSVTDINENVWDFKMVRNSSNYTLRLFDSAGSQIALSTTAATVDVVVTGTAT